MNVRICIYDNGTGIDIPSKINTFPVEVMLGTTIKEVHNSAGNCQLFGVFTHLPNNDFVVPTEEDKKLLQKVLKFGGKDYKVDCKPDSMWYNSLAYKNIIISDSVHLSKDDLSILIMMYIDEINMLKKEKASKPSTMYIVKNTRNSNEIIRTPNYSEATAICDKSPCTVIVNRDGDILYKSRFGRVAVSTSSARVKTAKLKGSHPESNGIFNIKLR